MSDVTCIGTNIVFTSQKIFKTNQGFRTISEYEGLRDACEGFAFQLPSTVEWQITDDERPKCKLVISAPYLDAGNAAPEPPHDVWELLGNATTKDVYERPNMVRLGMEVVAALRTATSEVSGAKSAEAVTKYNTAVTNIKAAVRTASTRLHYQYAPAEALSLLFFDLLLRGQTTYGFPQFVLRHTRIVGTKTDVELAFNNIEQIYNTNQVNFESEIPTSHMISIARITVPPDQTGYLYGWLKQPPTSRVTASNKTELSNEWWLDQWPLALYEAYHVD